MAFLQVPAGDLDTGYSLPLQRQAWAHGSEVGAVSFLMSDVVQRELQGIFAHGQATSLDAERKIACDKKNERSRLITVARASRNSILRQYRTAREKHLVQTTRSAPAPSMNAVALAINENPSLASNSTGRPGGLSVHGPSLREYLAVNRERLKEEAATHRREALQARAESGKAPDNIPYTNAHWLRWLEQNEAEFRTLLANAHKDRRALNLRLETAGVPDGGRVGPAQAAKADSWPWQRRLLAQAPGFFTIVAGEERHTLFHVALHGRSWCLPLLARGFWQVLPLWGNLADRFVPMAQFQATRLEGPAAESAQVYSLRVALQGVQDDRLTLHVAGATLVPDAPHARRPRPAEMEAESADAAYEDLRETSDDDVQSLASAAETGMESEAEALEDPGDPGEMAGAQPDEEDNPRAEQGAYVVWSNGYFSASNNPAYPDVKVRMLPRWAVASGVRGRGGE